MSNTRKFNKEDTIALGATLPRDLTGASVAFYFTEEENEFSATIKNAEEGKVAVLLSQVNPEVGYYEIKWKITYGDGTIEVLPPDGDTLVVTD